jgi:hypothetical protein
MHGRAACRVGAAEELRQTMPSIPDQFTPPPIRATGQLPSHRSRSTNTFLPSTHAPNIQQDPTVRSKTAVVSPSLPRRSPIIPSFITASRLSDAGIGQSVSTHPYVPFQQHHLSCMNSRGGYLTDRMNSDGCTSASKLPLDSSSPNRRRHRTC